MKILQALFVASAIASLAVVTAQAGELHGKAKPLDQTKGCGAYGAGFRRVPGSKTCVKIGGWVRAQSSSRGAGVNWSALNGKNFGTATTAPAARGYITTDVRTPTSYGTVRAYLSVGVDRQ
ncbi:MAG: porin [Xanthobacteraceae bacterium]